ncbi:MAG TPA: hypothetical protein VLH56_19415 [Dissulfurispiraceae bacterium]|nr:hypothetical protein [Dissulfurispiraceae bacterium]
MRLKPAGTMVVDVLNNDGSPAFDGADFRKTRDGEWMLWLSDTIGLTKRDIAELQSLFEQIEVRP